MKNWKEKVQECARGRGHGQRWVQIGLRGTGSTQTGLPRCGRGHPLLGNPRWGGRVRKATVNQGVGWARRAWTADHEEEGRGKARNILQATSPASGWAPSGLLGSNAEQSRVQRSEGRGWGPTYTEEEAPVLLDGPQAAQEARHHDDGAYGDDEVGCRQRGEAGGEGGKVALGHGEPNAHSKQPTATELERKESPLDRHCSGLHGSRKNACQPPRSPTMRHRVEPGQSHQWCDLHKPPGSPGLSLPTWQMG